MRKTKLYAVGTDGERDAGKTYLITEMPATQAEKWAARALLALVNAGQAIPTSVQEAGMAGLSMLSAGAIGNIKWSDLEPLMDEMMGCVQFQPDHRNHPPRKLLEDDVEEVRTRALLRLEVLALHMGFTPSDVLSRMTSQSSEPQTDSKDTQTSQG